MSVGLECVDELIDVDKLLVMVEARPVLYDITRKDHHNQDAIAKAWQDIGKELNVASAECKSKWHNVRSSYARYLRDLKKMPSGSGGGKKKKWHLADAMSFLLPYMGPTTKTCSNVSNKRVRDDKGLQNEEENEEENAQIMNNTEDVEDRSPEIVPNTAIGNMETNEEINPRKKKSKNPAEVVAEPMANYFKSITNKKPVEDHPVLMFFKGLMPDIKNLSQNSQRRFKTEILQSLNRLIDMEEVAQLPSHSQSSASVSLSSFQSEGSTSTMFIPLQNVLDISDFHNKPY